MSKASSFRFFLSCLCLPAILLIAGCADDLRNRSLFDCGAGEAVISYSVADVILTRDNEEEDFESLVDHAYLLFYAADDSVRTDVPIAAVRAESVPDYPGQLNFKMPLTLNPNTDYQLLAIANADSYTPQGFNNFGDYLESWCKNYSAIDYTPLQLNSQSQIHPEILKILPMCGEVKDGSFFRFSSVEGTYKISSSLSFRRKVARIDVANIIKEGFKVDSILLCNFRDAVDIYPANDVVGNSLGRVHAVLSEENANENNFIPMPEAEEDGIQRLNHQIYCFPSISYEAYTGDKESTALIIKAKYCQDAESSYYRVNVGTNGNVSEVKANTKYLITIQSVKGRGASSPEEAYAAKESPIVLSVVEDWDLDGSNFAMDEKGNFIVLSSSKFEFEGDDLDNREVKVLTSKGLNWTVSYVPDNEESSDAFIVSKLSHSSFAISPAEENTESYPFTGKCVVSAPTSGETLLSVSIPVTQQFTEKKPYVPVIPDMDFTIIPVNGERVNIDHDSRTIEIDAFDPDCFNSFIDIPFYVYFKSNDVNNLLTISSDLVWPLEGAISINGYDDYFYCANSFVNTTKNAVYSKSKGEELTQSQVQTDNNKTLKLKQGREFYISVGAMAPDDPTIQKTVTLYNENDKSSEQYKLIIKPAPTIIDDVILTDKNDNKWLIFDRNIQDVSSNYVGIKSDCSKYQAYNYTCLTNSSPLTSIGIPFKYSDPKNTQLNENQHTLYWGAFYSLSEKNKLYTDNGTQSTSIKYQWLQKYQCIDKDNCTSPFYDESIFEKWHFPSEDVLHLCASKMRVSKMRMFLVSDYPVKDGKNNIPVCCYWPFYGSPAEKINFTDNTTLGYFASDETGTLTKIIYVYNTNFSIDTSETNNKSALSLSRLVRQLSDEELSDYKQNYLGYGSQPFKLILCHPDTYGSNGWIPY